MRRGKGAASTALLLILLLAACRSGSSPVAAVSGPEPQSTSGASPASAALPPDKSPPSTTEQGVETPPSTAELLPDPRLEKAVGAGQAVVVTADAYGLNTTTLSAYERQGGRWRRVLGPWTARVGNRGFAPPGEKVEGDGRTPSGVYEFSFFFGVAPDPGVRFEYRQVPDDTIVWDEDPASPTYNLWIDLDDYGGGRDAEGMYQPVAYRYGAVIAYNMARIPGLGSGIFLHASTGRATAGCVSLPVDQLVALLRWLDPARSPRMVMGVA